MTDEMIRLQKWLAESGLCSRREGEEWILRGRVTVNGVVVKELGSKVSRGDQVLVDGRVAVPLREPLRILMLHKPAGIVCTRRDPEDRRSVFDLMGEGHARLISIGRLDYNSEGLLLFTNHGELAHQLMHPSNQITRTYRVRVHGRIDADLLARLQEGVMLEDGPTGPLELTLDHVPGSNSWVTITLKEGRNRIVRRIFAAVEMEVSRLIRVEYGPCQLGELPRGHWRSLLPHEMKALLASFPEADSWIREAKAERSVPAASRRQSGAAGDAASPAAAPAKERHFGRETGARTAQFDARPKSGTRGRFAGGHAESKSERAPRRSRDGAPAEWEERSSQNGFRKEREPGRWQVGERVGASAAARGKPEGERFGAERPRSRPEGERFGADRPRTARPEGERFGGDRPRTARPEGERFGGERPRSRPEGERFGGDRPRTARPDGERFGGDRPRTARPEGERFGGDRPRTARPEGERFGAAAHRDGNRGGKPGSAPGTARRTGPSASTSMQRRGTGHGAGGKK